MKKFALHLTDQATGESEKVIGEFPDEEVVILEGFLENLQRLEESRLVKEGIPGGLKLHIDRDKGFVYEVELPDEDLILAFLHRLRRFILNEENSSYNRVTGIIAKRLSNDRIRSLIKNQRKVYDGRQFQSGILIQSNGVTVNSEKMLFDWLNSFEYHDDTTKREEIEKLHQLMPLEVSRAVFLMLLTEKVKAIYVIADFVALILGKIETLETKA